MNSTFPKSRSNGFAMVLPLLSTTTAKPESTIGKLSSVVLKVETSPDVDPYGGLMAVGSSLAMEAICDVMVYGVLEIKGTPKEHFVNGHPGGIISKMAKDR